MSSDRIDQLLKLVQQFLRCAEQGDFTNDDWNKLPQASSLNRRNHCWPNKRNRNETWGGPSELSGVRQAARCLYGAAEPSWA